MTMKTLASAQETFAPPLAHINRRAGTCGDRAQAMILAAVIIAGVVVVRRGSETASFRSAFGVKQT